MENMLNVRRSCTTKLSFSIDNATNVFWKIPVAWATLQKKTLASQPGLEREWSDAQDERRPSEKRDGGLDWEEDRENCLFLEFYNDIDAGYSGELIEDFEAQALGVLRVNLSDFLMPRVDEQAGNNSDEPDYVREMGSTADSGGMVPDFGKFRPHPFACTQNSVAKSWWRRKERWVGGITYPMLGSRQEVPDKSDSSTCGFVVEARLELAWSVDRDTWRADVCRLDH